MILCDGGASPVLEGARFRKGICPKYINEYGTGIEINESNKRATRSARRFARTLCPYGQEIHLDQTRVRGSQRMCRKELVNAVAKCRKKNLSQTEGAPHGAVGKFMTHRALNFQKVQQLSTSDTQQVR